MYVGILRCYDNFDNGNFSPTYRNGVNLIVSYSSVVVKVQKGFREQFLSTGLLRNFFEAIPDFPFPFNRNGEKS